MARTAVTPKALVANAAITQQTTVIDSTLVGNGVAIRSSRAGQRLLLVLVNSAGGTKTATVLAGVDVATAGGAAWMQGLGDLTGTVAASSAAPLYLGPFDSARFEQADGAIYINLASGFTGTLEVYEWPAGY